VLPVAHVFTPGDGIGVADDPGPFPIAGRAIVVLDTRVTSFVPNALIIARLLPQCWMQIRLPALQYYTNTLLDKISKRPLE
jgi:hypothetical protein